MLAEFYLYICELFWNWAGLFWVGSLIFEVSGIVLRKNQLLAVSGYLDQWVEEETRIRILRTVFVVGLLIAGFVAWQNQYETERSLKPISGTAEIPANGFPPFKRQVAVNAKIPYEVSIKPSWGTGQIWVTERTADHFVLYFPDGTPDGYIDWEVIPLPNDYRLSSQLEKRDEALRSKLQELESSRSEINKLSGERDRANSQIDQANNRLDALIVSQQNRDQVLNEIEQQFPQWCDSYEDHKSRAEQEKKDNAGKQARLADMMTQRDNANKAGKDVLASRIGLAMGQPALAVSRSEQEQLDEFQGDLKRKFAKARQ